jgi:hypothetical protein
MTEVGTLYKFHVIDLSSSIMEKSLGVVEFKKMPRPGDWMEIELGNETCLYTVAQIVHELVPDETGLVGEDTLYVAEPRDSADARFELYEKCRAPD